LVMELWAGPDLRGGGC